MKYDAPDYEIVSVEAEEMYAVGYEKGGCAPNEMAGWAYVIPCEGKDDATKQYYTFLQISFPGLSCYTTNQPA